MSRKKKHIPKEFESLKGEGDTSANMYRSMLLHPAFQDLTASQVRLLLFCKSEYYGKSRHDKDSLEEQYKEDEAVFTFNRSKWIKGGLYNLYSNERQFYKDMDSLIEHGFVDCLSSGFTTRKKSVYRFSARWKHWGSKSFELPANVMTESLRRKIYSNV